MFRIFSFGLGGLLVALGIAWFFTSALDGVATLVNGYGFVVTPLSKMMFADYFSLLCAGLTVTGVLLLAFGIFNDAPPADTTERGAPNAS